MGGSKPSARPIDELSVSGSRLCCRRLDPVFAVAVRAIGGRFFVSSRVIARILPHASQLFDGGILQNVLGAGRTLFPSGPDRCHHIRVPELHGSIPVEARYERGVLNVTLERNGRYQTRTIQSQPLSLRRATG